MLVALAAIEVVTLVTLIVVVVLLVRRGWVSTGAGARAELDPRVAAALGEIPTQFARLEARISATDEHLRAGVAQLRTETVAEAQAGREAAERSAAALRAEVLGSVNALGETLRSGLDSFRTDNAQGAETLRATIDQKLGALNMDFIAFTTDMAKEQVENRDALQKSLAELRATQVSEQEKLRESVQQRLELLRDSNEKKLEQMRATVDEKLQSTLNQRLTESFGQVATSLGDVQRGLGEMKELANGVGDLKKVLTNVKARGNVGEFLLEQQLEQMFSREQFGKQVQIKPGSSERVDFALKFPNGPGSTVLLPIDAKFPQDIGQKLMDSYDNGSPEELADARKLFDRAIRAEAQKICDKYLDPPTTLPHGIMFLPTEGLYAEVTRVPGLLSDIQQRCRVTVAGPATFMAILTSFQMGFHTLAIEKKGNEVWNVLGRVRSEFEKFGGLMEKVERNVGTVQNTLQEIRGKTTTINRSLKNVARLDADTPSVALMADSVLPLLAAEEDESPV